MRELRQAHGRQLKDMAKALRVSSAYLSALEHGHRAQPKTGFVQQVAAFFNLAWDEVALTARMIQHGAENVRVVGRAEPKE